VQYVDLKSGQVKVWKLLRQNRQASAFRHPCPEVMAFTSQGRLKDEKEQCNSGSMDCRLCIKKLLVTYLTYKAFLEVSRTNTCYCDKKRSEWCCVQLLLWFCDCSCYLLATQNVRVCTFGATHRQSEAWDVVGVWFWSEHEMHNNFGPVFGDLQRVWFAGRIGTESSNPSQIIVFGLRHG
jgi:hypothetical protein